MAQAEKRVSEARLQKALTASDARLREQIFVLVSWCCNQYFICIIFLLGLGAICMMTEIRRQAGEGKGGEVNADYTPRIR